MLPYISEFIGTMLLILLGDGVVANVNLDRSGMKGAGAVQITFAWGVRIYWFRRYRWLWYFHKRNRFVPL